MDRTLTTRIHLVLLLLFSALVNVTHAQDATITALSISTDGDDCETAQYQFSAANIPTDSTFIWDLGNGTGLITADRTPQGTYNTPGDYVVTLQIGDGSCVTCNDTVVVRVFNLPLVDFTADQTTVCKGDVVNFSPSVTLLDTGVSIASYEWTFGDAGTSTDSAAQHTYLQVSDFRVTLRVTTADGCSQVEEKDDFITVQNTATSEFDPQSLSFGCVNESFSFTNNSSMDAVITGNQGSINASLWDFGDGNTATLSNIANASNVYTATGLYDVSLISVASTGCNDTLVRTGLVQIVDPVARIAQLTDTVVCIGEQFSLEAFTDSATAAGLAVASYDWTFTGANTGTATGKILNQSFTNDGFTSVELVVTYVNGCTSPAISQTIQTLPAPLVQGVATTDVDGCFVDTIGVGAFFEVNFEIVDAATRPGTYVWDFGNGTSITGDEVTMASVQEGYSAADGAGDFNVTLEYTDANGCTATDAVTIVSIEEPQVDFVIDVTQGCPGQTVLFDATASISPAHGAITGFEWNFDGSGFTPITATEDTNFVYNDPGVYQPVLRVTTNDGCTNTFTLPGLIEISEPPVIDTVIIATSLPACHSSTIDFLVVFDTTGGVPPADSLIWTITNLTDGSVMAQEFIQQSLTGVDTVAFSAEITSVGQFGVLVQTFTTRLW